MIIKEKLLKDIEEYCKYNNIDDIDKEINTILQIGFNVIRYGNMPFSEEKENKDKEKVNENVKCDIVEEIKNNNDDIKPIKKQRISRIIKN